jgi:hypothetical protein
MSKALVREYMAIVEEMTKGLTLNNLLKISFSQLCYTWLNRIIPFGI